MAKIKGWKTPKQKEKERLDFEKKVKEDQEEGPKQKQRIAQLENELADIKALLAKNGIK